MQDLSFSARGLSRFKAAVLSVFAVCLVAMAWGTRGWPLVNDAALMRYTVLMLEHHWMPYRDIIDINLPGSYFVSWLALHTLGPSAMAWRVFDLLLLGATGGCMVWITWPYSRFAGGVAAALFALFHARDGAAQLGQRDLVAALLMLAAVALLVRGRSGKALWFGLLLGMAATLKPLALLALPLVLLERRGRAAGWLALWGAVVGPLAVVVWLVRMHALEAFRVTVGTLLPLYAAEGNRGFAYQVKWFMTPSLFGLAMLGTVLALRSPDDAHRRTRVFLLAGFGLGVVYYFAQMKGYPYHRYPPLAFLLLFVSLELAVALGSKTTATRLIAVGGLLFAAVLAPLYTARALRDQWPVEPMRSLGVDLAKIGPPIRDGDVQCLDTISGCLTELDDLRVVQKTGMLYDEFLFQSQSLETPRQAAVVGAMRERFLVELKAGPPRAVILTPWLFPSGPDGYAELRRWPSMEAFLADCYVVQAERMFERGPTDPGYRLYVRRPGCQPR